MTFDLNRLLPEMLDIGDPAGRKGRFRARTEINEHLRHDPYAAVRAIAVASAESLIGSTSPTMTVSPDPLEVASHVPPASPEEERAFLLLRAMIAAAKADGDVDPEERARILGRLKAAGADARIQRFVETELARPVDLYAITSGVRDAATAAEVYAASLVAIRVDTEAERRYLDHLAMRLGLDRAKVEAIDRKLGAPPAGGAPVAAGSPS